ncbi:hypothetical protein IAT38_004879 [Cryptococcus sp. DSM 104549]
MRELRRGEKYAKSPEVKIQGVEGLRQAANQCYRSGQAVYAAIMYIQAWSAYVLPFSAAVLPVHDPVRAQVGQNDAVLWCNVSAACITLSKDNDFVSESRTPSAILIEKLLLWAYIAAWAAWDNREYAQVSTVRNACLRMKDTLPLTTEADGFARDSIVGYLAAQAAALKSLPKDMPFKDVPAEKKIELPPREDLDKAGPHFFGARFAGPEKHMGWTAPW